MKLLPLPKEIKQKYEPRMKDVYLVVYSKKGFPVYYVEQIKKTITRQA